MTPAPTAPAARPASSGCRGRRLGPLRPSRLALWGFAAFLLLDALLCAALFWHAPVARRAWGAAGGHLDAGVLPAVALARRPQTFAGPAGERADERESASFQTRSGRPAEGQDANSTPALPPENATQDKWAAYCRVHPADAGCGPEGFRAEAAAFAETLDNEALPCPLARVSADRARDVWNAALWESMAELGSQGVDEQPWLSSKPWPTNSSPVDRARFRFAWKLFDGKPGVVEGLAADWPAIHAWQGRGLESRVGQRLIDLVTFAYPGFLFYAHALPHAPPAETLGEYVERNESARHWFVFINEPETTNHSHRDIVEALRDDFKPHPAFAATPEERHALLVIDALGSSHGLHRHGAVWNTQVVGRKAWWLLPPEVPSEHNQPTGRPFVDGKVVDHPNACAMLRRATPPPGALTCVTSPGESLVLPQFWWHATCALDPLTAGVGGWLEDHREHSPKQLF